MLSHYEGVFDAQIQHLIVLATNAEIRLLGANVDDTGALSMYLTDIQVTTDDVVMLSVTGLSNGQIFLGGRNGHLYELEYEVRL